MEKQDNRKFIKKRDVIIIAVAVIIAAVFLAYTKYSPKKAGQSFKIYYNDNVIGEYPLDKDRIITLEENPHVEIQVKNGSVGFIASDCPDKVCIKSGFLNRGGQSAACLPNKVMVVVSSEVNDADLTVG